MGFQLVIPGLDEPKARIDHLIWAGKVWLLADSTDMGQDMVDMLALRLHLVRMRWQASSLKFICSHVT
eukprot:2102000-Lingulodinium_polyedra.AAC.1